MHNVSNKHSVNLWQCNGGLGCNADWEVGTVRGDKGYNLRGGVIVCGARGFVYQVIMMCRCLDERWKWPVQAIDDMVQREKALDSLPSITRSIARCIQLTLQSQPSRTIPKTTDCCARRRNLD